MVLTRTVAAALACGALLAACSSDPQPKFEDSPSPSPSASSASPVVESSSPAKPAQTPEDVVRAWIDARNSALKDGDVESVRGLSTTRCRTCEDSYGPIAEVFADGGRYETAGWTVVALKVDDQSTQKAEVSVALRYEAGQTVTSAGAAPVSYGVERHIAKFRLRSIDDEWRVDFIGYLS